VKTPIKLGAYGLVLTTVFAGAVAVGSAVGPVSGGESHPTRAAADRGHRDRMNMGQTPGMNPQRSRKSAMPGMAHNSGPEGLAASANGYTLSPTATILPTGTTTSFTFRILGPDGTALTAFTPEHEKELHFIVVGRDLTGYQHLHPTRAADGTWSVPLRVPSAGAYKAFADFQPVGHNTPMTLAVDLSAPGAFTPASLPATGTTATVDDYHVSLTGRLVPGQESELTFTVVKDGRPVTDLQPYLAAYGHLVALRVGDLAYLHVHPDGAPGDGHTPSGPQIVFHADVLTPGPYRLFLDFRHGDVVRTAELTVIAAKEAP